MKASEIYRQTLRNVKKLNEKHKDITFSLMSHGTGDVPKYMDVISEQEGFGAVVRKEVRL